MLFRSQQGKTLKFHGTVSRYNNEISIRQDEIKQPSILANGTDPAARQRLENELAQKHEELEELRPKLQQAREDAEKHLARAQDANIEFEAARKRVSGR